MSVEIRNDDQNLEITNLYQASHVSIRGIHKYTAHGRNTMNVNRRVGQLDLQGRPKLF